MTPKKKCIRDFESDTKYYHWISNSKHYECDITFRQDYLIYEFSGQCQYSYFTYDIIGDTIDWLWTYKTDCNLDLDFLDKSNGIRNYPKYKDSFAAFTLVNDSVIRVDYHFPEWVMKVNEMEKDSIFPTYLYLQK